MFILPVCLSKLNLKHFARHVTQLIRSKDSSLHRETAMIAPYVIKNCSPLALAYCLKLIFYTFHNIYAWDLQLLFCMKYKIHFQLAWKGGHSEFCQIFYDWKKTQSHSQINVNRHPCWAKPNFKHHVTWRILVLYRHLECLQLWKFALHLSSWKWIKLSLVWYVGYVWIVPQVIIVIV